MFRGSRADQLAHSILGQLHDELTVMTEVHFFLEDESPRVAEAIISRFG